MGWSQQCIDDLFKATRLAELIKGEQGRDPGPGSLSFRDPKEEGIQKRSLKRGGQRSTRKWRPEHQVNWGLGNDHWIQRSRGHRDPHRAVPGEWHGQKPQGLGQVQERPRVMELDTQEQTSVLRNLCWKEEERDRVAAGRGGQLRESF